MKWKGKYGKIWGKFPLLSKGTKTVVHTFLNLVTVGQGVGAMEAILKSRGNKLEDKTDMLKMTEENMARMWALGDVIEPLTQSALEPSGDSLYCLRYS